ncbi:hypothetical protein FGRMN_7633 [Fusarium graminum]|nr:hypothetical protein FGRMN_7633 [Fusarium graminum]
MKQTRFSLLIAFLASDLMSSKYTVEIPKDVIWVKNWDQLHAMAARYQDTALVPKYGGNVIEVDGRIILATDEKMTKQIDDFIKELEKDDPGVGVEPETSEKRDLNIPVPI